MLRSRLTQRLSVPGQRLGGLSIPARIALGFLLLVLAMAVFAPLVSQHSPLASGPPVQPPSPEHWFGTDRQGRDVFARLAYGARYSLTIGLAATGVALLVAAVLG